MFKGFTHINTVIDDFGNEQHIYHAEVNNIFSCFVVEGAKFLFSDNAVKVGPTIPGVKTQYLIHKDELESHKQSIKLFHESEQNCNTCIFLERITHPKDSSGFLYGKCKNSRCENTLYNSTKEHMMFHPDDPMHMSCYQARWNQK